MMRLLADLQSKDFTKVPQPVLDGARVQVIFQIVFGIAGGIALIVLILAGLRYVTSQGDPASTAKAKNAIIYAAIGIVVCMMAFSIVTFVVRSV